MRASCVLRSVSSATSHAQAHRVPLSHSSASALLTAWFFDTYSIVEPPAFALNSSHTPFVASMTLRIASPLSAMALSEATKTKQGHGVGTSPIMSHSPLSTRCLVVNFSQNHTSIVPLAMWVRASPSVPTTLSGASWARSQPHWCANTCAMRCDPLPSLDTPKTLPFTSAGKLRDLPFFTWTPQRSGDCTYVPTSLMGPPAAAFATAPSESITARSTFPSSRA
mmetsp:Transcript_42604/g.120532  ORF Transcript_42604/g.120532 Transcript_42604/m.120532 type:complete len:223 (-) Transcript_42604:203-871(-)